MSRGIARLGDKCHGTCYHSSHHNPIEIDGMIVTASPNAFIDSRGIARIGDRVLSDCGHEGIIVTGMANATINGRDHARLGDKFQGDYIGIIITASSDGD